MPIIPFLKGTQTSTAGKVAEVLTEVAKETVTEVVTNGNLGDLNKVLLNHLLHGDKSIIIFALCQVMRRSVANSSFSVQLASTLICIAATTYSTSGTLECSSAIRDDIAKRGLAVLKFFRLAN